MRLKLLLPLLLAPVVAQAQTCETTVGSADTMTFDVRSITVPSSCETFTVHFQHRGRMPKTGMGHNWVLARSADVESIAKAGVAAGAENSFIAKGDARVIAATPLLGGGESASVSFQVSALGKDEKYTYFCSFPGHWSMMRGSLKLEG